jgi:hypothetical protein
MIPDQAACFHLHFGARHSYMPEHCHRTYHPYPGMVANGGPMNGVST